MLTAMRSVLVRIALLTAVFLGVISVISTTVSAQKLPPYSPVTDARLRNQDSDSWLLLSRKL